jgi:N-acetylglucosaminyldiphosphoundecaprenol N-acetyl-beta-D-mannosaminyltransferase
VDEYDARQLTERILNSAFTSCETSLVATLNAQLYVLSANDLAFCACLERAEFLCADGKSISFASGWLAGKQLERIAGVDLIVDLCAGGAARGLRVFFLGGKPGAAQDTADKLAAQYKGLQVVGIACPPLGFERDPEILSKLLAEVAEAEPHIIFVGLGAPKQEMFIDQHLRALRIPVAIGVGGSFEMLSGRVRRAPCGCSKVVWNGFFDSAASRADCGGATVSATFTSCGWSLFITHRLVY